MPKVLSKTYKTNINTSNSNFSKIKREILNIVVEFSVRSSISLTKKQFANDKITKKGRDNTS